MVSIFENLPFWLTVAGILLVILEAMAPGAHFIVLGVALLVAGLLGLAAGSFGYVVSPLLLALAVVVGGGVALFVYREFDFYGGKGIARTSDSESLSGKTAVVTEEVTRSSGEVKLEDGSFNPYFQARSIDATIPEGEEVVVVDPGGGNVLTVQAFADEMDDIDRELAREREAGDAGTTDDDAGTTVDEVADRSGDADERASPAADEEATVPDDEAAGAEDDAVEADDAPSDADVETDGS